MYIVHISNGANLPLAPVFSGVVVRNIYQETFGKILVISEDKNSTSLHTQKIFLLHQGATQDW